MQIAIISAEFLNSAPKSRASADVELLANALVALDHEVRVISPLPAGMDINAHSLARRLSPIEIDVGGHQISCFRYDGRTSEGVSVNFIELEQSSEQLDSPSVSTVLVHGALEIIRSLSEKPDWGISWGTPAATFPSLCRADGTVGALRHLLVLTAFDGRHDEVATGVAAADRVVVRRHLAAQAAADQFEPLVEALSDGRAIPVDNPVPGRLEVDPPSKASAKTTLQHRLGLPVDGQVPLVLFQHPLTDTSREALLAALGQNVQLVLCSPTEGLDEVAGRYPDRLGIVPDDVALQDVLFAVDAAVAGEDESLAHEVMSCGAVPIVAVPQRATTLVELDPALRSGSSIVIGDLSPRSLIGGLGRLQAAVQSGPRFLELTARLPRYVVTWEDAAEHYLQLMS